MSAARALARRLDAALFGPEAPARLAVVQGGFLALVAARTALSPFRELTPQPRALFRPVPFLRALDQMPSATTIAALQAIGVLAAVAWVAAGTGTPARARMRRVSFAVAWAALVVLVGLRASRGKILHNDLLLVWGAVPLLFAPGDARLSDRRPSTRAGWPIRTSIAVVSLAYFLAGYWKLLHSGPAWVFGSNMRWILYHGAVGNSPRPDVARFVANHAWLSVLTAGLILALELSFPVVVVVPWIRPAYVVAAWALHAGTYVVLGLDYWSWAAVVTLVLVDWAALLDRLAPRPRAPVAGPP